MKIATWNLERPQSQQADKLATLRQRMERVDADIWILTETHRAVSPGDGYLTLLDGHLVHRAELAQQGKYGIRKRPCPYPESRHIVLT